MDYFRKGMIRKIGPGGWKCFCCGPMPKDRPLWRRMNRRRIKQNDILDQQEKKEDCVS